jgi:hypothetical protein
MEAMHGGSAHHGGVSAAEHPATSISELHHPGHGSYEGHVVPGERDWQRGRQLSQQEMGPRNRRVSPSLALDSSLPSGPCHPAILPSCHPAIHTPHTGVMFIIWAAFWVWSILRTICRHEHHLPSRGGGGAKVGDAPELACLHSHRATGARQPTSTRTPAAGASPASTRVSLTCLSSSHMHPRAPCVSTACSTCTAPPAPAAALHARVSSPSAAGPGTLGPSGPCRTWSHWPRWRCLCWAC